MGSAQMVLPQVGAELVTVVVGGQHFAIDIMAVREIRGWTTSTPLPHAPPFVLGMINLRGAVLPVIDLGARLGLGGSNTGSSAVVIVADIGGQQVGLLVDEVSDILTVAENLLQAPPDLGDRAGPSFVRGLLTTEEGIVTLLTLDGILPGRMEALEDSPPPPDRAAQPPVWLNA